MIAEKNPSKDKLQGTFNVIKCTFVEVKINKSNTRKFVAFKAICDSHVDSENEVDVRFLKNCTKKFFSPNEDDVSSILVNVDSKRFGYFKMTIA